MKSSVNLILAAGLGLAAGPLAAATFGSNSVVYSLGNEGTTLVTIAAPGQSMPIGVSLDFGTMPRQSLDALAYRPSTGQLYGYDNESDAVYLVNPMTGQTSLVVQQQGLTSNDDLGFDFNNVLDAARIVTAEEENRVFFPNTMPPSVTTAPTDLFFVAGDANAGRNPNVVANAYTNAVPMPSSTEQFVIDSDWDILATLGNNAGTLNTVGELFFNGMAFDVTEDIGFDILSFSEGDNTAFALLTERMTGGQSIFEVPLMADMNGRVNLSLVTELNRDFGTLNGLAVAPAPVPVPAALPLLAAGLVALGFARSRRA
ncbi:hypothetical protein DKT77_14340 [Meridianimarinicoccus roseus]|uniref:DUF4394 domain-containing protein n=1 Tax=Meridianimarinicoccus roseus TaxID=2072018 RepID=A0A2V2L9I4_9RHOB|nr:DUF4394 domain-containing protein [Meridianimarinicoccus roseus]PWR01945.1 hypothetical protein DKT77_14340 [Meridianimarinicoccus roseus]